MPMTHGFNIAQNVNILAHVCDCATAMCKYIELLQKYRWLGEMVGECFIINSTETIFEIKFVHYVGNVCECLCACAYTSV